VAGDIDGAIVMVPAKASADVVRQCIDAGVRNIWLFKGVGGPGSTSAEATALCRDADVEVIDGACPLMFLDHAGWVHRFHHAVRSARGAIVNCRDLS
jgi:acyl-CoA synthetase (NDP forming)